MWTLLEPACSGHLSMVRRRFGVRGDSLHEYVHVVLGVEDRLGLGPLDAHCGQRGHPPTPFAARGSVLLSQRRNQFRSDGMSVPAATAPMTTSMPTIATSHIATIPDAHAGSTMARTMMPTNSR